MSKISITLDTETQTCEVSINGSKVKGDLSYLSLHKSCCYDSKEDRYYFSAEFKDLEDGNSLKDLGEDVKKSILISAEANQNKTIISSKNNDNNELSRAIAYLKK